MHTLIHDGFLKISNHSTVTYYVTSYKNSSNRRVNILQKAYFCGLTNFFQNAPLCEITVKFVKPTRFQPVYTGE